MNDIQILAILALISMSIPAALAFMFWRERNQALYMFENLEYNYRALSKINKELKEEIRWWRSTSKVLQDDTSQWDWS